MSVDRAKWRNVSDLYVTGVVVPLEGDSQIWLQVLNPFEQEECRTASRAARARAMAALKPGCDELEAAKAAYLANGRQGAVEMLVQDHYGEFLLEIQNELEADPEWHDRLVLVHHGSDVAHQPATPEEEEAITDATREYMEAMNRGHAERSARQTDVYEAFPDDRLEQEIVKHYIDRRGNEAAGAEYGLCELYLAARICDAEWDGEKWVHAIPSSERVRIWDSLDEVRALPDALLTLLRDELGKLNMSHREGKGSGARAISSISLPPSKPAEDSTPSTPDETPSEPLGTST